MRKNPLLTTALMWFMAAVCCYGLGSSREAEAADGKTLFVSCAACHGKAGEGNAALGAPSIAGLQSWYLKSQLEAFSQGRRGYKPGDTYGVQMRAAITAIPTAADRAAVVAYIAKLPTVKPKPSGKPADKAALANGSTQFNALCSSCHGSNGLGNQALGAPRLAGQNSAYLARQLAAFRNGQRGAQAGDKFGKQMAAMSKLLTPGKNEQDTLSYITTLKP